MKLAPSSPASLSIADALRRVRGAADLTPLEQREQCCALNKIVAQDGRPAEAIPLTPDLVRRLILQPTASMLGLSSSRKSAIISHLRRVMERLGLIEAETMPYSEAWDALLTRFDDPRQRARFTALARFCSAGQINPEDVRAPVLLDWREHLATRTLTANPAKVVGATRGAWNRCCQAIRDWPGQVLPELRPL